MHQSLTFKQICFAPFKFPFCFPALANISINEVDGCPIEANRNALCHNGNVEGDTAFPVSNRLQFNSLPRSEQGPVIESLSAQLLGYYQVRKPLSRRLFSCVPEHSREFLVDPQHMKIFVGQD